MMNQSKSRKARRGPDTAEILQLHIELQHVQPAVTRTLLIRATSKLSTLHNAIQAAMGWEDCHLHQFDIDGTKYGPVDLFDVMDDAEMEPETKQVGTLFREVGKTASYFYDFGDGWQHTITLENRLPPDLNLRKPMCIAGENACPPEDVGGPPGYMYYIEAVLDPTHDEHEDMIAWRGPDFHPAKFSLDEAQGRMKKYC